MKSFNQKCRIDQVKTQQYNWFTYQLHVSTKHAQNDLYTNYSCILPGSILH